MAALFFGPGLSRNYAIIEAMLIALTATVTSTRTLKTNQ